MYHRIRRIWFLFRVFNVEGLVSVLLAIKQSVFYVSFIKTPVLENFAAVLSAAMGSVFMQKGKTLPSKATRPLTIIP